MLPTLSDKACHNCDYIVIGYSVFLVYTVIASYYIFSVFNSYNAMKHKAVGMYEYREHAPYKLSGGQKQRVAIAGILAMLPECIVLDEPTAMLDPNGRDEVLSTLLKLNKEKNITVVLITHYMDEAVLADRVVVMDSGKILTQGTPDKVFSQVELLKRHRLDVPQSTELANKLRGCGVKIDKMPLDTEACVKMLEEVLK